MNTTSQILMMQSPGVAHIPPIQAKGPETQGLLGFLNALMQQLQTAETGTVSPLAQISPENLQALTEKIAALLQKDMPQAAPLQALPPEQLAEMVAALLQKNGATAGIQPSLTSDLVALLSSEIQEIAPKAVEMPQKETPALSELAALLNEIQPAGEDGSEISRIISELKAQTAPESADADILQALKDKVAELQLTTGEINKEVLVDFKADIIQPLKDQGLDQPAIEHYLAALAKFLRQDAPVKKDAAIEIVSDTPVDMPADAPLPQQAAAEETAATAPKPESPSAPKAAPEPRPALIAAAPDMPERAVPAPAPQKDEASSRPQLPAAPPVQSQPAQTQTAPPQPVTAKIAGFSVNPALINAMAQSDGNFTSNGFQFQGNGPQEMMNAAGLLKPVSVDTLNNQNFTNYMNAARNQPSPVAQMVHIQLQRNINAKIDTMTLQLEPADLGRLDIKLTFEKEGRVRAHMTVDKPETLALLQKDSHLLERALQQAGIDADENSLSFDLRQQGREHNLEGFDGGNRGDRDEFNTHLNGSAAEKALQAKIAVQANGYITQSGVNIVV